MFGIDRVSTVSDKDDIAKIIEIYRAIEIQPLDPAISLDITTESFQIFFTLANGEIKGIYIGGGFMYTNNRVSYSVSAHEINEYESAVVTYKFNKAYEAQSIYLTDGTMLCEINNLGNLEFVQEEYNGENEPQYYIDYCMGKYHIDNVLIYDEHYCSYNGRYYKLNSNNFYDIIGITE